MGFIRGTFHSKTYAANLTKKRVSKLRNVLFFCGLFVGFFTVFKGQSQVRTGADQISTYASFLQNKKVGVVAHSASIIQTPRGNIHLIDSLQALRIDVQRIFAPEHGFRGNADAGEKIKDGVDSKTNLPVISLYGKERKPSPESLKNIDVVLFDLQDVGVRFYTYLSTLHYVMEACAENNIPLWVLDRPNPNIHYVDGPVLEMENQSFVGMHPVPIVYGMTIGEYAQMINGEGWLKNGVRCDLQVVSLKNYTRETKYVSPVSPSPNLPNAQSIALYPSLCLLEPTVISVGRGTEKPFQVYGHPELFKTNFSFTPIPRKGAKKPKLNGQLCYGKDLSEVPVVSRIELKWLIQAYTEFPNRANFFKKGFARIAGTKSLQRQIEEGRTQGYIRRSWKKKLTLFKKVREKYLTY